jgi:hypothetical protein
MQKLLKEVRKKEALLKDWKEAIILKVDVEESIVNAPLTSLQSKKVKTQTMQKVRLDLNRLIRNPWWVHNRLFNVNFEEKFHLTHPILLFNVKKMSPKQLFCGFVVNMFVNEMRYFSLGNYSLFMFVTEAIQTSLLRPRA